MKIKLTDTYKDVIGTQYCFDVFSDCMNTGVETVWVYDSGVFLGGQNLSADVKRLVLRELSRLTDNRLERAAQKLVEDLIEIGADVDNLTGMVDSAREGLEVLVKEIREKLK